MTKSKRMTKRKRRKREGMMMMRGETGGEEMMMRGEIGREERMMTAKEGPTLNKDRSAGPNSPLSTVITRAADTDITSP